jgi:hypothetical protein
MAMAAYEEEAAQVLEEEEGTRRRLEGDQVQRSDDGFLTHMTSTRRNPTTKSSSCTISLQHLTLWPPLSLLRLTPSYTSTGPLSPHEL